jgi:transposase
MKLLVYARILNPASKKETFESKDKYFDLNCDFSLDDLYRSLSIMNQFKKDLERWVYTQIKEQTGRDTTLVFYDVTNYYFETETEDENTLDDVDEIIEEGLRRKGVSKEHRPEPIVQMGLLIDNNGIPIAYRLFPGNTNDKVTLIPVLNELKEKYELGRVIVVADKGLNSGNNLLYITNNDNGYIVSQQIRKRKKEMIEKVLDEDGYIYNESKTFKIKDWTEEKQVKDQTGNPHILKEKVVSFWSKDFETREKYKRGNLEEIIEKFQKNPKLYTASNAYGVKKYLKEKHVDQETGEIKKKNPILLFDQEKYERDCALDGYYMIVTSELNLSNEEIIEKYSGLSIIEESFRIIKSDLEGRPVYVWTKEHIEAHFLICFMALVIMRILQKKLDYNYSAQKIQKALSGATCKLITQEIYSLEIQDDTYQDIERVNNVSLNKAYVKKTELKAYQRNVNKK